MYGMIPRRFQPRRCCCCCRRYAVTTSGCCRRLRRWASPVWLVGILLGTMIMFATNSCPRVSAFGMLHPQLLALPLGSRRTMASIKTPWFRIQTNNQGTMLLPPILGTVTRQPFQLVNPPTRLEASMSQDDDGRPSTTSHKLRYGNELVVVIPAYNEQGRIGPTLQTYHDYLSTSLPSLALQQPILGGHKEDNVQETKNCRSTTTWEVTSCRILVVDDGSVDDTVHVVQQMARQLSVNHTTTTTTTTTTNNTVTRQHAPVPIDCVSLPRNGGKGAALAYGIQTIMDQHQRQEREPVHHIEIDDDCTICHKNTIVVTTDADGSAPPQGMADLYQAMLNQCGRPNALHEESSLWGEDSIPPPVIVAGCRRYADAAPLRRLFRWGFRTLVQWTLSSSKQNPISFLRAMWLAFHDHEKDDKADKNRGMPVVVDSQCGFKLFSSVQLAQILYQDLHVTGWSHDVEVLYRASLLGDDGIAIVSQTIDWTDQPGSKLEASPGGVVAVSGRMFWDVLRIQQYYHGNRTTSVGSVPGLLVKEST